MASTITSESEDILIISIALPRLLSFQTIPISSPMGLATIATTYSAGFSESVAADDSRTLLDFDAACSSKNSPQCRHLTALANTCSPQNGQAFIAGPEAAGLSCTE